LWAAHLDDSHLAEYYRQALADFDEAYDATQQDSLPWRGRMGNAFNTAMDMYAEYERRHGSWEATMMARGELET
jgi:hypothetical protein